MLSCCEECNTMFVTEMKRINRGGKFCSFECSVKNRTFPLIDRFYRYVGKKQKNGCILWIGKINQYGYGMIGLGGKCGRFVGAHRISYELFVQPILENLNVLHDCDVRNCINPIHLFLGTNADNTKDMLSKMRHVHGADCYNSVLNDDIVREIKYLYRKEHKTLTFLADKYGVSISMISKIMLNKAWRHIK